ncbi:RNA binding motif protein 12Bb [Engraulis encrasicolus]|uniref:RNA binding motif protein 12Bb n=1 Tax=Engraulis encrasicolus TaxID=184585 RepID=UPI002FD70547
MAVVIRLQGLRVTAGSEDIRSFFTGLKIPDGGVHIIGGDLEEAFIIFASDEDARRAMSRSGGCIKGGVVHLLLSSKSEMQKVLEASTKKPEASARKAYKNNGRPTDANPGSFGGKPSGDVKDSLYLYLSGMPFSTKDEDILKFFTGLRVSGIRRYKNNKGLHNGTAMVKFETIQEAAEGLKRDRQYIGSRYVCIKRTEIQSLEQERQRGVEMERQMEMEREREEGRERRRERDRDREPVVDDTGFSTKPSPTYTSRKPVPERARSRSPRRSPSQSPSKEEFCVMVDNLSLAVEKADLKQFFHPTTLRDDQIIHVNDKYGKRTRSAFVLFGSLRDYCAGLSHHKEELLSKPVYVSPVSKEKMIATLQNMNQQLDYAEERERSHSAQRSPSRGREDPTDRERVCLYVRNLPFDVRKVEIMDFFHGFRITEDSLILLRDENGAGLGEALLIFQTENEAIMAQSLNGQRFLGSEVMLKCITRAQMREFGVLDQNGLLTQMDVPKEPGRESYSAAPPLQQHRRPHYSGDDGYMDSRGPADLPARSRNMPHDMPHDMPQDIPPQSFGQRGSHYDAPYDPHFDHPDMFGGRGDGHSNPGFAASGQHFDNFDNPTCVQLSNLPAQIHINEIYDFCYGYRVIPGSATLQFDRQNMHSVSTVVFESHHEAVIAVEELNGRPIGKRKISVRFM